MVNNSVFARKIYDLRSFVLTQKNQKVKAVNKWLKFPTQSYKAITTSCVALPLLFSVCFPLCDQWPYDALANGNFLTPFIQGRSNSTHFILICKGLQILFQALADKCYQLMNLLCLLNLGVDFVFEQTLLQ